MGAYCLCQPPKKTLAGKPTCQFSSNKGSLANRLDLVFDTDGKLIDYSFCSVKDDRRIPVDPKTEKAVETIISAIKTGESILGFAKDFIADPSWVGGEILPDVSPQEFELNTLDWPQILAEKTQPQNINLVYFGKKEKRGTVERMTFCTEKEMAYFFIEPRDQVDDPSAYQRFVKALYLAIKRVGQEGENVWDLLKEKVIEIDKAFDGLFPFIVLEEEHVIIFQAENWLEILATNLPLNWD